MRCPRSLLLALLSLSACILGCSGVFNKISNLTGAEEAATAPASPLGGTAPDAITSSSIVLMGMAGKAVTIYDEITMDPDGDMRPRPGRAIKNLPAGTRGHSGIWHDVGDWTYAIGVELVDGTKGVVRVEDVGTIHRVTRVRSDDTLNVRSGRSPKMPKITELHYTAPVFVAAEHVTDMAGCEGNSGAGKWWRVRTLNAVEGYVNCHYLGAY